MRGCLRGGCKNNIVLSLIKQKRKPNREKRQLLDTFPIIYMEKHITEYNEGD